MAPPTSDPTLLRVRERLAAADMDGVRQALLGLSDDGRRELEQRLGAPAVARLLQGVRRARGATNGRVVVIHGIMGGKLATVDRQGDQDLVWVNYLRLIAGRIGDFTLDADGNQADPRLEVITCGLLDEYLPLVVELDRQWQVLPFAFDWRLDIDRSAEKLNEAIVGWAHNEPVHIVAHSMGGLVSRRFMQLHADTWSAMADRNGLKRGGRLVMLGTPNRGSFAISFVLTGEEKTVRMLERFDVKHDLGELLAIINTFVGSYQMMPSPEHPFGDDRRLLYQQKTWGRYPVAQANLDRGSRFQQALDAVTDAERLVYVAGYDQDTPYRIRVDGPGKFSYQQTRDGDGRVPHELGLLPGVRSFFVREKHGDLPSNDAVLAGIHELLQTGSTTELESQVPVAQRGVRSAQWRKASEIAPIPPEVEALVGTGTTSRRLASVAAPTRHAIESALVDSFVGSKRAPTPLAPEAGAGTPPPKPRAGSRRRIKVELMWGDVVRADGEIFAAGHYQGVLPQAGELALDRAASGVAPGEPTQGKELVITSHTRRGIIRGAVGDVNFFPWAGRQSGRRTIVIAGMGHPGTFGKFDLERLARSLTESISALPSAKTVNMLLIGSGNGGLPVPAALDGLLNGMVDALAGGAHSGSVRRIRIVERDWKQATEIASALQALKNAQKDKHAGLDIEPRIVAGEGGVFGDDIALSTVLVAAARQRMRTGRKASRSATAAWLRAIPEDHGLRRSCEQALRKLAPDDKGSLLQIAEGLNFGRVAARAGSGSDVPTCISFIGDPSGVRAAAITDTAVVPERSVAFDWKLVDDLIVRMTDPEDITQIPDLAGLLTGFMVPRDFRERLRESGTMIFELDRQTARVHWEMLGRVGDDDMHSPSSIALEHAVSRQLRTSYSPPPSRAMPRGDRLRALVIGDPGDPEQGYSLPGARAESLEVAKMLSAQGVQVDALIGAPNARRDGELREYQPATVLEVLRLLRKGGYDLLHYSGHGDFDPNDPEKRAGWIFGDGFFTSRELACIDKVPALVVANACLSALTSSKMADKGRSRGLRSSDDALLPGLVDEFFKRGVRNYVGTAWPINDVGAIMFTETFYRALIPSASNAGGSTLGEALLGARKALKQHESQFQALWAAYQHYGDPSFSFRSVDSGSRDAVAPAAARSRRRKSKGRR